MFISLQTFMLFAAVAGPAAAGGLLENAAASV
jgi:hypothetical protein